VFFERPGISVRVASPLADGTDRVVVTLGPGLTGLALADL
jgi:hypothetical protein